MKFRRIKLLVIVVLLIGASVALFTDWFGGQLIPGLPKIKLTRTERTATSAVTLSEVRSLSELSTIQLIHRAVFPYDYFPEGVSLPAILRKLRNTDQSVRATLTKDEYDYFQAYSLAEEVNLGVSRGTFDFVVVTLIITAGVDVGDDAISLEISRETTERREAMVSLPPARVLSVRVEDINPEEYPYPSASISADGLRRVADFVVERLVPEPELEELLREAESRTQQFIEGTLIQAGYERIEFR